MKILGVGFRFKSLIWNTEAYIKDIVIAMLREKVNDLEYLKLIDDICLDDDFNRIYLFSLNHDNVLENFLISKNLEFENGFKNFLNPSLTSKIKFYDKNLVSSRGGVIKMWDLWKDRGKIIEIKKRIENTNWQEIKKHLN